TLRAFDDNWMPRSSPDRARLAERAWNAQRGLAQAAEDPAVASALAAALKRLNGIPGDPASFEALNRIVSEQHYRPAFWRVALDEINYRRFFDINDLASLRIEDPRCFEDVHRLAFRLIEDGWVQGLRIDHIDGLWDPKAYAIELRARAVDLD